MADIKADDGPTRWRIKIVQQRSAELYVVAETKEQALAEAEELCREQPVAWSSHWSYRLFEALETDGEGVEV